MSNSAIITTIEAGKNSLTGVLAEVWAFRGVFLSLVRRDVKARYAQTLLGAGWVFASPLAQVLIYTLLFGKLMKVPSTGSVPYALFAMAGILSWQCFSRAVNDGSMSLVANRGMIQKVYIPRLVFPGVGLAAALVDFAVSLLILAALMLIYWAAPSVHIWLFPVYVAYMAVVAYVASVWLSALCVFYRDVQYLVGFAMQLLFFLTPIIYPPSFVPAAWRWILAFNPMMSVMEGLRWTAFAGAETPSLLHLGIGLGVTATMAVTGLWFFRHVDSILSDEM